MDNIEYNRALGEYIGQMEGTLMVEGYGYCQNCGKWVKTTMNDIREELDAYFPCVHCGTSTKTSGMGELNVQD